MMCLYVCILLKYRTAYTLTYRHNNNKYRGGVLLIMIFTLFAVQDTDYFHYIDLLDSLAQGRSTHVEEIYVGISSIVNFKNIPFRLIVWGTAILLYVVSIKRLDIPIPLVLFFFSAIFILKFSYARASLAMSIGLLGYVFCIRPLKIRMLSIIIGVLLVFVSLIFHKSAIFWLLIFGCSFVKLDKLSLWTLLFLYPVFVLFTKMYGVNYFFALVSDELADSASAYMKAIASARMGLNYYVRILLERTPYYLMLFGIILSVINGKYQNLKSFERRIINVSFYIIYFSSFFLFDFGVNTSIMYYRFLYFSILPLPLMMAIFYTNGICLKLIKFSLVFGITACLYNFLYSFYNAVI